MSKASSESKTVNWGIIGCGAIAHKWARAIQKAGHNITAVASRELSKAQDFAKEMHLNCNVYDDYQKLIEDKSIRAVYLSIPTTQREEWVLKCLYQGLHVLMDKPHVNATEVGVMLEAAYKRNLQLMDGVMFMHSDRLKQMEQCIKDGALGGAPKRVMSMFSDGILDKDNIRLNPKLEPMGSLADLGTYCTRITLWAFNWDLPDRVRAEATHTTGDAITGVVGWMLYDDGRVGSFDASNASARSQWAHINGPESCMKIHHFVAPAESGCEFDIEKMEWSEDFECKHSTDRKKVGRCIQEANAVSTISGLITSQPTTDVFWGIIAMKTQLVLDSLLESIENRGAEVTVNKELVRGLEAKLKPSSGA